MKKIIKNCISILLLAVFFISCTGYRNKGPEQVIELADDAWIMDKYFPDIEGYDKVEYERIYFDWHDRLAVGPTDYRFRGVIQFTEEQASALWDQYEWEQVAEIPDFEFDKVNKEAIGNGPWYDCKQFEKDNLLTVNVFYAVFDGNDLVFDIQQY